MWFGLSYMSEPRNTECCLWSTFGGWERRGKRVGIDAPLWHMGIFFSLSYVWMSLNKCWCFELFHLHLHKEMKISPSSFLTFPRSWDLLLSYPFLFDSCSFLLMTKVTEDGKKRKKKVVGQWLGLRQWEAGARIGNFGDLSLSPGMKHHAFLQKWATSLL